MVNAVFIVLSVLFAVMCIANVIYSIIKFRSRNVDSYIEERNNRKQKLLNGK